MTFIHRMKYTEDTIIITGQRMEINHEDEQYVKGVLEFAEE